MAAKTKPTPEPASNVAVVRETSTFASMAEAGAFDAVAGQALRDKASLLGVPMMLTRVVFRESDQRRPDNSEAPEYASVEAVTNTEEHVVFNDGSTGIRRQLVEYLTAKGRITPPQSGASPDGSIGEWDLAEGSDVRFTSNGDWTLTVLFPGGLLARNGLRRSDYPATDTRPAGTTYYLS